ncbi:hypothetical protein NLU13_8693 [Sarocladium strictum]|uniref:Uncharacterized protein n=1 Tax=Sarocladium strictum TaxID=5046 RepID=A0AA39GC56_SARSR|nr:hypothetical protein NLU13_8693 [Sarocladium strictum]
MVWYSLVGMGASCAFTWMRGPATINLPEDIKEAICPAQLCVFELTHEAMSLYDYFKLDPHSATCPDLLNSLDKEPHTHFVTTSDGMTSTPVDVDVDLDVHMGGGRGGPVELSDLIDANKYLVAYATMMDAICKKDQYPATAIGLSTFHALFEPVKQAELQLIQHRSLQTDDVNVREHARLVNNHNKARIRIRKLMLDACKSYNTFPMK